MTLNVLGIDFAPFLVRVAVNFITGFAGDKPRWYFAFWRDQEVAESGPMMATENAVIINTPVDDEPHEYGHNSIAAQVGSELPIGGDDTPTREFVLFALQILYIGTGGNFEVAGWGFPGVDEHERESGIADLFKIEDANPSSLVAFHHVSGIGRLGLHFMQSLIHCAELFCRNSCINGSSEKSEKGDQYKSALLPIFLIALGFFVSWYVFFGSLRDGGSDDPWDFPLLLAGCFGSIAYGTFLLFDRFTNLAQLGMKRFKRSFELVRKHGPIPTFTRRITGKNETRIPRRALRLAIILRS
jgi:hypothetical protein